MLLLIPYPEINPVLIIDRAAADPLVCAGLYRRADLRLGLCPPSRRQGRALGRTAASDAGKHRRSHRLCRLRHNPRRPARLRAVLQSRLLFRPSGRDRRRLEGRHVVSRRPHRRGCSASSSLRGSVKVPVLSVMDVQRRIGADRAFPRAARQFHQAGALGATDGRALGDDLSGVRWACRAIQASSMKRAWRASCCSSCSMWRYGSARLRRPGLATGIFALGYGTGADHLRILPRARPATRLISSAGRRWAWFFRCR